MTEKAWPEAGLSECEVEGCRALAVAHGKCEAHARMNRSAAHRGRVGRPSGQGLFGVVTRTHDRVQCHECGRWFKRLELHVIQTHGMEVDAYRDRHGLLRSQTLTSEALEERFREKSLERVGGADWDKFAARRDETLPESQKLAHQASIKRNVKLKTDGVGRPRQVFERLCLVCGTTFTVEGSRSKTTCSSACHDTVRRLSRADKAALLDKRAREAGWPSFDEMLRSGLTVSKVCRLTGASRKAVERRREKMA